MKCITKLSSRLSVLPETFENDRINDSYRSNKRFVGRQRRLHFGCEIFCKRRTFLIILWELLIHRDIKQWCSNRGILNPETITLIKL